VLAHAEIVVGAPDGDFARRPVRRFPPQGPGIAAGAALEVGEHAIAAFCLEIAQPVAEELLEIHRYCKSRPRPAAGDGEANAVREL
jgi:hypothetical protein